MDMATNETDERINEEGKDNEMTTTMAQSGNKVQLIYNELPIAIKVDVIKDYESQKCSQRSLAKKYKISRATVNQIIKQKSRYFREWEKMRSMASSSGFKANASCLSMKRVRKTNITTVNTMMEEFVETSRIHKWELTGPKLKEKAKQIARNLGLNDFKASNGWLDSFKKRCSIEFNGKDCHKKKTSRAMNVNYQLSEENNHQIATLHFTASDECVELPTVIYSSSHNSHQFTSAANCSNTNPTANGTTVSYELPTTIQTDPDAAPGASWVIAQYAHGQDSAAAIMSTAELQLRQESPGNSVAEQIQDLGDSCLFGLTSQPLLSGNETLSSEQSELSSEFASEQCVTPDSGYQGSAIDVSSGHHQKDNIFDSSALPMESDSDDDVSTIRTPHISTVRSALETLEQFALTKMPILLPRVISMRHEIGNYFIQSQQARGEKLGHCFYGQNNASQQIASSVQM